MLSWLCKQRFGRHERHRRTSWAARAGNGVAQTSGRLLRISPKSPRIRARHAPGGGQQGGGDTFIVRSVTVGWHIISSLVRLCISSYVPLCLAASKRTLSRTATHTAACLNMNWGFQTPCRIFQPFTETGGWRTFGRGVTHNRSVTTFTPTPRISSNTLALPQPAAVPGSWARQRARHRTSATCTWPRIDFNSERVSMHSSPRARAVTRRSSTLDCVAAHAVRTHRVVGLARRLFLNILRLAHCAGNNGSLATWRASLCYLSLLLYRLSYPSLWRSLPAGAVPFTRRHARREKAKQRKT